MSFEDDVFDVDHHLDGNKILKKKFNNIIRRLADYERKEMGLKKPVLGDTFHVREPGKERNFIDTGYHRVRALVKADHELYIDVVLERGQLEIRCNEGHINVTPGVANVVYVGMEQ